MPKKTSEHVGSEGNTKQADCKNHTDTDENDNPRNQHVEDANKHNQSF